MTTAIELPPVTEADDPAVIWDELAEEIRYRMTYSTRSVQRVIGPSGIGTECDRALLYMLAGVREPSILDGWRAQVGTWMHAGLERVVKGAAGNGAAANPRYLVEHRVMVGYVDGVEIWGTADVFDTGSYSVLDWKSAGKTVLAEVKRKGTKPRNRVQAHLYGAGMVNAGYPCRQVINVYLPRDGSLSDAHVWAEPFNPDLAAAALARATERAQLIRYLGLQPALDLYAPCQGEWCGFCQGEAKPGDFFKPRGAR